MPRPPLKQEYRDPKTLLWIGQNRGVLTKIAKEVNRSAQFVHLVYYGRRNSSDGRVERLLRERGAPIARVPDKDKVA